MVDAILPCIPGFYFFIYFFYGRLIVNVVSGIRVKWQEIMEAHWSNRPKKEIRMRGSRNFWKTMKWSFGERGRELLYDVFLFFFFFGVQLKGRGTGINLFNKKFIIKKKEQHWSNNLYSGIIVFFLEPIKYKLVPKKKEKDKRNWIVWYITKF